MTASSFKVLGLALLVMSGMSLGLSAPPARADHAATVAEAAVATELSPDEFLAAFDNAVLPGLHEIGTAPAITGNSELDARIRTIAESRGYKRQPSPSRPLVSIGNQKLQPEAAAGWTSLKTAASEAGFDIAIRSSYRTYSQQAWLYNVKHAKGTSDAAINNTLKIVAAPGYSKHHTGYAIDITSVSHSRLQQFVNSPAYTWMAANNFANAKAHGWIPSYPDGSRPAGPNPEPWEFVWVGPTNIVCGDFEPTPDHRFCDTIGSQFGADIDWLSVEGITTGCTPIRFCGDQTLTRGQAATFLWRFAGEPEAEIDLLFVDVPPEAYFYQASRWLFAHGLTTGTSQTTFDPGRLVSRAEFVTFLWRFAGRPEPSADIAPFADVMPSNFSAKAITWAAENGITTLAINNPSNGTPLLFAPTDPSTRNHTAAFIHRFAIHQNQSDDAT